MYLQTLTATDVLNIFIELHRLTSPLDSEADPKAKITFDMTVSDWRSCANDLLPWNKLYPFLNQWFQIALPQQQWQAVFTGRNAKLTGVCELISAHSTQQNIITRRVLGNTSSSATVFRLLKQNLSKRSIDVKKIKPSTDLSDYMMEHAAEILEQVTIMTRGNKVFEQFKIKQQITVYEYRGKTQLTSFLIKWYCYFLNKYKTVTIYELGNIKTFRDLTLKMIEVTRLNI